MMSILSNLLVHNPIANPVITTILGAAPGGISGMSLVGSEYGVGAAVATLHAVRLITVLLILPLVVKCLNLFGVIKP